MRCVSCLQQCFKVYLHALFLFLVSDEDRAILNPSYLVAQRCRTMESSDKSQLFYQEHASLVSSYHLIPSISVPRLPIDCRAQPHVPVVKCLIVWFTDFSQHSAIVFFRNELQDLTTPLPPPATPERALMLRSQLIERRLFPPFMTVQCTVHTAPSLILQYFI